MRLNAVAMSLRIALSAGAICYVAAAAPDVLAQAQAPKDPLTVLIDQGKYWQSHQRGDLAEQAWQKVLRIDPKPGFKMELTAHDESDAWRTVHLQTIGELAERHLAPATVVQDHQRLIAGERQVEVVEQRVQSQQQDLLGAHDRRDGDHLRGCR